MMTRATAKAVRVLAGGYIGGVVVNTAWHLFSHDDLGRSVLVLGIFVAYVVYGLAWALED